MGLFGWISKALNPKRGEQRKISRQFSGPTAPRSYPATDSLEVVDANADGWFMPKYCGRNICDWVDDVKSLKRDGDLDQALVIAHGCMDAMVDAARHNPINVMEFYVNQVAIIQHKIKDYTSEIETIEGWLGLEFPAPRQDYRLGLQKRLAKAYELLAKERGEDSAAYRAEWKRLLELEKTQKSAAKTTSAVPSTGKSFLPPDVAYVRFRRRSGWVAPRDVLSCPSFVAVDFETANSLGGVSACQLALVKVDRGRVVDRAATLIKSPAGFDEFEFTYLHGISARDVRNSPMWPDVAGFASRFVNGLPVHAHNASFDAKVWEDLDSFFGTQTAPNRFFCSYRTARKLVPGLDNYKLPTVTNALVPGYRLNHHEAESDAEACALIVAALQSLI